MSKRLQLIWKNVICFMNCINFASKFPLKRRCRFTNFSKLVVTTRKQTRANDIFR